MPCLSPSSFHTSLPWTKSVSHKERQRVEILQKQKKALTTLKFKEVKMTATKRNGYSIPTIPTQKAKWMEKCKAATVQSLKAPMQGCNVVQCGAMWQGNHNNCWQHFSVNAKISNMWWVWHNFENVWKRLLQRRIFSSGLRCNVKYFEFSGDSQYPICICFWCVFHHEIFSCWFFTFLLPTVFT